MNDNYKGILKFDEPMSKYTSLGLGGPADVYAAPEDILSLKQVVLSALEGKMSIFPIGLGTNLLVKDSGIQGVVISMQYFNMIRFLRDSGDNSVLVFVEAGTPLGTLIAYSVEKGYSGLEALSGIPGSVGGAVFMNAGSFGKEILEQILSISVMNGKGGIFRIEKKEMNFSYRRSGLPDNLIILSVIFKLHKDIPQNVLQRVKKNMGKKKTGQPLCQQSAGCVFKNPIGDYAGRLLDASGCKGLKIGGAEISNIHANFIINRGDSAADFIQLMEVAQNKVAEKFSIQLEPEIKIVGREDT